MTLTRPYKRTEVRDDYWRGVWDYARGKPANKHRRYEEALKLAKTIGPHPFNPWWIRTWQDVEAVLKGCYFQDWVSGGQFYSPGDRVYQFFAQGLNLSMEGIRGEPAGRPYIMADFWRWDITMPVFGWMRPDGTRRFRQALIWVPKKNMKSIWLSGIGLYFLTKDVEMNAQVYSAALSREQAGIVHDEAVNMVNLSEELSKRLHCVPNTKTITNPSKFGKFKALAYQSGMKRGVQEGRNWNAFLFDEVHTQTDAAYFDSLKYGGISRSQAMLIEASTSGIYDVTAVGWTEYERMLSVHTGSVRDMETFTYLACAEKTEDWLDPKIQKKANPGIDISIKSEDLAKAAQDAKNHPKDLNEFLRYRMNIWVHSRDRLVSPEQWEACACPATRLVTWQNSLAGRPCWEGLDLSLRDDITADALFFPEVGDEPAACLPWFWLPKDDILSMERKNNAPYTQWADEGFLELTPGDVIDYGIIEKQIRARKAIYNPRGLGCDPKFANQIMINFINEFGQDWAYYVAQSALTMGPPTHYMGILIAKHKLMHPDNPILNWHVSNAQAYSRAGNVIVMKDERGKRFKVDGFVALIIAAQRAMCAPPEPETRTEGIFIV